MSNILNFLITTFVSLFCATLFIRAWIFWRRIPAFNPYCTFIYQLTDFVIVPVRKIISSSNHIDFPSLVVAYITCTLQALISRLLLSSDTVDNTDTNLLWLPFEGLYLFLHNFFSCVFWLGLMYAILSWVAPLSPFQSFLRALIEPVLEVIRHYMPKVLRNAPIDFSLMALMLLIIIAQMLVDYLLMTFGSLYLS
ncbi:YggT family protein [Pelistega europaea]|uniref:YggT family protein n=1 Tax=Pelistega europaea TaxID=106147 RepID=A0A7Y4P5M2_9BURK|nr:YggT family protein [Pelistega europaea]NOL49948.1 YggT family protein [Pelistega europaea]